MTTYATAEKYLNSHQIKRLEQKFLDNNKIAQRKEKSKGV